MASDPSLPLEAERSRRHSPDRVLMGLVAAFLVLAGNFGYSIWGTTQLVRATNRLKTREVELFDEAWQVRYYDEALTHNVSESVLTGGEFEWHDRYNRQVVELDRVLKDLQRRADQTVMDRLRAVDVANVALVDLETQIFRNAESGRTNKAKELLLGPYVELKAQYAKGLDAFFIAQRRCIDEASRQAQEQGTRLRAAYALTSAFVALALVVLGSLYRRQSRTIAVREHERERDFEVQSFDQRLNRALDMAQTEAQTLTVVRSVLEQELPHGPSELLLADSSRAHLRQVVTTDALEGKPGCSVASPTQCPAIRLGSILRFDDPQSYDACPHLRERSLSGCRALCAPVSVTGLTVGVLHTLVSNEGTNDDDIATARRVAERVGTRAGERLGILRAFQQTQLQAATDPLTGLLNRRSLEAQASERLRSGTPMSVLYLDLDHFKTINDTHGHDTGDRALRQFSKVLRDSTRSSDLVGRWGGEEFLIVIADDSDQTMESLYERIQESLVVSGAIGNTPAMTTSAGGAQSDGTRGFVEMVAEADAALLCAKQQGRNRLVLSSADSASSAQEVADATQQSWSS